jgi:hypothetical protein
VGANRPINYAAAELECIRTLRVIEVAYPELIILIFPGDVIPD